MTEPLVNLAALEPLFAPRDEPNQHRARAQGDQPNFTGAFVGMACQDTSGTAHPADFDFFEYKERGYRESASREGGET